MYGILWNVEMCMYSVDCINMYGILWNVQVYVSSRLHKYVWHFVECVNLCVCI